MKKIHTLQKIFMLFLASGAASLGAATVYVKKNASGSNNGTSWANAYTNLQTALTNAASGSEIWISADTFYLPTGSARSASFAITSKNLSLFGAFPNTGNPGKANRDLKLYKTIISGDISRNDAAVSSSTTTGQSDRSDNAYHVFVISQGSASYNVYFDGITIEGGNANGSSNDAKGAAVFFTRTANGTGSQSQLVQFNNCELRNNTATEAACFFTNCGYVKCDIVVLNIYASKIYQNAGNDFPVFSHGCPTNGNLDYRVNLYNNLIYKNYAINSNSALMLCSGLENSSANSYVNFDFNFNTFAQNSCTSTSGLIIMEGQTVNKTNCKPVFTNNLVYGNTPSNVFFKRSGKSAMTIHVIDNNRLETTDSFIIKYSGGSDVTGIGNPFKQISSGDYSLPDCSPYANAGKTEVYWPDRTNIYNLSLPTTTDALYNNRINGGIQDIGACEYSGTKMPAYTNFTTNLCFGETTTFNGKNITVSGNYFDTLAGSNGCDSFITNTVNISDSLYARIGLQFNSGNWYVGCLDKNNNGFKTYQWYINDTLVPGATTYYLARSKYGKYYCKVTKLTLNGNTCSSQSPDYIWQNPATSRVNDLTVENLLVYPNPATGVINWNVKGAGFVRLSDMTGKILKIVPFQNGMLDVQDLPSGMYILHADGKSATRLMKE